MSKSAEVPVPGPEPRPITLEEYQALTPEKLELFAGYLIDSKDRPEERRRLLALLLVNQGLEDAVRLAPESAWREALEKAYR